MMLRRTTTTIVPQRAYSTKGPTREGWLYIDTVFPVQIARWDIRHYIGLLQQDHILSSIKSRLELLSSVQNFRPLELQPHPKDGGVFVRFSYDSIGVTSDDTHTDLNINESRVLETLEHNLREEVNKHGPLPSWLGPLDIHSNIRSLWLVKGVPWREDMNRFASPFVKVAFEGPDIHEEVLYDLCRPYGKIRDLTTPTPVSAGSLRSSTIIYYRRNSATIARNVIHGLSVPLESSSITTTQPKTQTRIHTQYQTPHQAHLLRDWISNHPRISLPIIVFLLGTLTYTIFDPIRAFMIKAKMLDWFDYRQFRIYEWLRRTTMDHLSNTFGISEDSSSTTTNAGTSSDSIKPTENGWKERKDAESAIGTYLSDLPVTIAFIHGPQGSGKSSLLDSALQSTGRASLTIDIKLLNDAPNDSTLVGSLAKQAGYWPFFTFWNSASNLVDVASVGLIGQKAGLTTSTSDQLRQILMVVTKALKAVSKSHRATIEQAIQQEVNRHLRELEADRLRREIREGSWHDGRIDCVAGNGVISELGVGIERFDYEEKDEISSQETAASDLRTHKLKSQDVDAVRALPIIVLKNYSSSMSRGSPLKEEILDVLAEWAAKVAENQIAHVIVLSDNRENAKRLAKALPTKPLHSIALSDADAASSLSFVKQKLNDASIKIEISGQEATFIERLGGRSSDLESLIHKVRSGMKVSEAVEDIINRGVAELRKSAFGEDTEDAKGLPWTREQAWKVLKALAKRPEVGYYDILLDFPFKGDESALRYMEHAELIAISTKDERPSTIRPGKPVFWYVFQRVVNDKVFEATQELAYNEKQIAEAETKIRAYEAELAVLVDTMKKEAEQAWWWDFGSRACRSRVRYLNDKLFAAGKKVEILERKNNDWKKIIKEGHSY